MDVTANNAFNRWKAREDCREPVAPATQIRVYIRNTTFKRRLVHHDHCRPLWLARQRIFKPANHVVIHIPMVLPWNCHVEAKHSHRPMLVGDEVHWLCFRQIGMIGEAVSQILPIIVVARNEEERLDNSSEEIARDGVFSLRAVIHEIAAENHQVRARKHAVELTDRRGEHCV